MERAASLLLTPAGSKTADVRPRTLCSHCRWLSEDRSTVSACWSSAPRFTSIDLIAVLTSARTSTSRLRSTNDRGGVGRVMRSLKVGRLAPLRGDSLGGRVGRRQEQEQIGEQSEGEGARDAGWAGESSAAHSIASSRLWSGLRALSDGSEG